MATEAQRRAYQRGYHDASREHHNRDHIARIARYYAAIDHGKQRAYWLGVARQIRQEG